MASRVFIISHSPRFDYSSAEEFGEPVYILADREITPLRVDDVIDRIFDVLCQRAFDPAKDYVAVTGPSALVALFLAYIGSLNEEVNLLLFDAGPGRYRHRVFRSPHGRRELSGDRR